MLNASTHEKDACNQVSQYQVSLNKLENNTNTWLAEGSGTLVKFSFHQGINTRTVYGVLTASHVAIETTYKNNQKSFIHLTKLINGDTEGFEVTVLISLHDANKTEWNSSYKKMSTMHAPDLAFIALNVDPFAKDGFFESNNFFDLDAASEFALPENPALISGFFRGACESEYFIDGVLTETGPYIGGGEVWKQEKVSDINYWKIPNPKNLVPVGASGAAFWRFFLKDNILIKKFSGVITQRRENYIYATSEIYIYDNFLYFLKTTCAQNL